MKRLILIGILILTLVGCGFGPEVTTQPPVVVDTDNYIEISDVAGLKAIEMNKSYILLNDLDLLNEEWIPLGNYQTPFLGNFDGNGKTITNLTIKQNNTNYNGLFGYVKGNIENLNILDFSINYGTNHITFAGGLAGFTSGNIKNVSVEGDIEVVNHKANSYLGLLVGVSTKSIRLNSEVANFTPNQLINNHAVGQINLISDQIAFVGGLVGKTYNTKVDGNVADSLIIVESKNNFTYIGGLIGHNYSGVLAGFESQRKTKDIKISNNISNSQINTSLEENKLVLGGLIGYDFYGVYQDNFAKTSLIIDGGVVYASLGFGEAWYSEVSHLFALGNISLVNQSETPAISPIIAKSFGVITVSKAYFSSETSAFNNLDNRIVIEDISLEEWLESNLEWSAIFIANVLDYLS